MPAAAPALHELELALGVARSLASGADIRRDVVAAARTAADADWTAIVEREHGRHRVTAVDGLPLSVVTSTLDLDVGGIRAVMRDGTPRWFGDARNDALLNPDLVRTSGTGAIFHQPIGRQGAIVGVLLVGWADRAAAPAPRLLRLLELLALDLAFALERDELVARLATEARTDPLTGLANRRAWEEQVPRELRRAARHGLSATLALIDVDDLKRLNDSAGHAAGDALLRAVADRWRGQIREADLLARVGGDEFALLLAPSEHESGPAIVARLVAQLPGGVTCSAGIVAADGETDLPRLLADADAALYLAKRAGKGRVAAAPQRAARER